MPSGVLRGSTLGILTIAGISTDLLTQHSQQAHAAASSGGSFFADISHDLQQGLGEILTDLLEDLPKAPTLKDIQDALKNAQSLLTQVLKELNQDLQENPAQGFTLEQLGDVIHIWEDFVSQLITIIIDDLKQTSGTGIAR